MFRETTNGCFVGSKGRGRPFCGSMRSVRPTGRTDCTKNVRTAWFCGFTDGTVSRRSSQHLGGAGVSPVTKPISGRPLDPIPKRGFKGVGLRENFKWKAPSIPYLMGTYIIIYTWFPIDSPLKQSIEYPNDHGF